MVVRVHGRQMRCWLYVIGRRRFLAAGFGVADLRSATAAVLRSSMSRGVTAATTRAANGRVHCLAGVSSRRRDRRMAAVMATSAIVGRSFRRRLTSIHEVAEDSGSNRTLPTMFGPVDRFIAADAAVWRLCGANRAGPSVWPRSRIRSTQQGGHPVAGGYQRGREEKLLGWSHDVPRYEPTSPATGQVLATSSNRRVRP